MKEESTTYDSVAWGRQLGGEREANWLGDLDSHTRAYPERVAQARQYFTEIPFDSLTVVKTGPDRFSLVDAEGTELRSAGFDPLQSSNPASRGSSGSRSTTATGFTTSSAAAKALSRPRRKSWSGRSQRGR